MAEYVRSGPCTKCGSSDAAAQYSDGSSFCFSCKSYTPGHITERLKPRKSNERAVKVIDTQDWQYSIPYDPLYWLKTYGITDAEIKLYGIRWNPKLKNKQWDGELGALAMPIFENGRVVCVSYRLFTPGVTKSVTLGYRTYKPLDRQEAEPILHNTVVVVEDYVSAVKVSRHCPCIPLLGTSFPDEALLNASKTFSNVLYWLDEDKLMVAASYQMKTSLIGCNSSVISTMNDPKQYDDKSLIYILSRHKEDNGDRKESS
jgi:hypothetical protein